MFRSLLGCVFGALAALAASGALAQAPVRMVLTSATGNIRVEAWSATSAPGAARSWSVRKTILHGGKQEGVDLITVQNGALSFSVIPTRGMGLFRAQMGDVVLGWRSPVTEVVNPAYIDLEANNGLGWLDGFNEWMPRGGIEWSGHPGLDGQRPLSLHGRIANIPASEVVVLVEPGDRGSPGRIRIQGVVHERSMFGANFTLTTEISSELGSNVVRVADVVTNHSAQAQEFQLLYHSNYGEPILEGGAKFVAAAKEVRPLDGNAAQALGSYADYGPPTPGFVENVFGMRLHGDRRNMTTVMLRNAAADKAVTLRYSLDQLPFFTLWKNTGASGEAFVTGLEPGTSYPSNRSVERMAGRVGKLAPGASQAFAIDFAILRSKAEVAAAAAAIAQLGEGQPTALNPQTIKPSATARPN